MSEALLANILSGKPAHGGWGEALARALTGGIIGMNDKSDRESDASSAGEMARAFVELNRANNPAAPVPQSSPTSALPSPRLPAIGSAQDMTPVTQVPNERVAAGFDGLQAPQQSDYGPAIAKIESGGRYDLLGPVTKTGDRAHGKYQVMGANIGPWTTAALGRTLTPQQFLADPVAQEAVFKHRFGSYVDKHGPEGAARAWFAGEGGMNDPNRRDQLGTSVADYAAKFNQNMGQAGQAYAQAGSTRDAATERMIAIIEDPKTSPAMRAMVFQQLQQYVTKPQADFGVIGEDAEGNKVHGWIDKRRQTTTPAQMPGAAQGQPSPITLPDGRTITPPPGVSAKDFRKSVTGNVADAMSGKMTESQGKANSFANRMETAMPIINDMESVAGNVWDSSVRNAGYVPEAAKNWLTSDKHQQYNAAKGRWIAAFLRKDSGAVINPDEFTREDKNYFPQPGEGKDVIEQKRIARQIATEAMKREAGLGYQSPSIPPRTTNNSGVLSEAKEAIARGAPRDKVIERLRSLGVDPGGL